MLSFSRSLNKELENTNVHISILCPGGVLTNEDVKLRTQELGYLARKAALEPEVVAQYSIDKMLAKKEIIVPGRLAKVVNFFTGLMPYSLRSNIMANQFIKNSR